MSETPTTPITSEPQLVTLKIDPPSQTNLSSSLNIITKKPNTTNSIFIVPSSSNQIQSSSNQTNIKLPANLSSLTKKIIINPVQNVANGSVNFSGKPGTVIGSSPNTKVLTTNLMNSIGGSNLNSNKIQYVKIVNSGNNIQQLASQQQASVQGASSNNPIKITTISANTNTNAITTTTTNSDQVLISGYFLKIKYILKCSGIF